MWKQPDGSPSILGLLSRPYPLIRKTAWQDPKLGYIGTAEEESRDKTAEE